jgi:hypothetical protein
LERPVSSAVPATIRAPLTRPWPGVARAVAGGAIGWIVAEVIVDNLGPSWRVPASVVVMAAIALGAPLTARAIGLGGPPAWGLAAAIGLYLGVPETDHVLGLGAGLGVLVVAELTGSARADGLTVLALGGVLVWAILQGAGESEPALLAGFATLGLIVLWPVVRYVPGPARALAPHGVRPLLVTAAHTANAWIVGRRGALIDDRVEMATIGAVGAVALVIVARLVVGARTT